MRNSELRVLRFYPYFLFQILPLMKAHNCLFFLFLFFACNKGEPPIGKGSFREYPPGGSINAVNIAEIPLGEKTIVIQNVNLIDGTGQDPVPDALVVIEGNTIVEIGRTGSVSIPEGSEIVDGDGWSLLPGLIDAHFHLDGNNRFPNLFLKHGATSLRDPGAWIESYDMVRKSEEELPRLFLTGPHLDMPPPAYPTNSYLVRDPLEARYAVNKFADQGATAIKVYFRLPAEIIREICTTAGERGIPVTAHLEITSAREAITAGVNGIEHVTSFGTDLLPTFEAEQYKQSVMADNNARRDGRYQVWNAIDLENSRVDSLLTFLKKHGTVLSPTLGAFEYRFGDDKSDSVKVKAFEQMLEFTGMAHKAGVPIVVGSHSWVPYAEVGWAYQHEMELLAEAGLTTMEVIKAATIENARFLRIEDRLGSIEVGKEADLLLVEEDPLQDLGAIYNVKRVMLNGRWVK